MDAFLRRQRDFDRLRDAATERLAELRFVCHDLRQRLCQRRRLSFRARDRARLQRSWGTTDDSPATSTSNGRQPPREFSYALKSHTAKRTEKGWYVARAWCTVAGEKPEWIVPFETIEAACLAIARRLATEIADRHSMMIEAHKIRPGEPLYGLKPTTRLRKAKNGSAVTV